MAGPNWLVSILKCFWKLRKGLKGEKMYNNKQIVRKIIKATILFLIMIVHTYQIGLGTYFNKNLKNFALLLPPLFIYSSFQFCMLLPTSNIGRTLAESAIKLQFSKKYYLSSN